MGRVDGGTPDGWGKPASTPHPGRYRGLRHPMKGREKDYRLSSSSLNAPNRPCGSTRWTSRIQ